MKRVSGQGGVLLAGGSAAARPLAYAAKRTWDALTAPVRGYLRREAVYRDLTEMDDRMLADIGLNRGDVHAVASGIQPPIVR